MAAGAASHGTTGTMDNPAIDDDDDDFDNDYTATVTIE